MMSHYRRNTLRSDVLSRNPTAGLPLFDAANMRIPRRARHVGRFAPKALEIADGTRHLAHTSVTFSPDILASKQRAVFHEIRLSSHSPEIDITNQEIADRLGWPVNRVTGRTYELRELGLVIPSRRRVCRSTGSIAQAWRIP